MRFIPDLDWRHCIQSIRIFVVEGAGVRFAHVHSNWTGEVNTAMPYHVVDAVASALNDRQKS